MAGVRSTSITFMNSSQAVVAMQQAQPTRFTQCFSTSDTIFTCVHCVVSVLSATWIAPRVEYSFRLHPHDQMGKPLANHGQTIEMPMEMPDTLPNTWYKSYIYFLIMWV